LEHCQRLRPTAKWLTGIEEKVVGWVRACIQWGYKSETQATVENVVFNCVFWPNSLGYSAITLHVKQLPSMAELMDIQRYVQISFYTSLVYSLAHRHPTKTLIVFVVPFLLIDRYREQIDSAVVLPQVFRVEHVAVVFVARESLDSLDCKELSAWIPGGDTYRWALRNPPPISGSQ
jgi:hypothetical protein